MEGRDTCRVLLVVDVQAMIDEQPDDFKMSGMGGRMQCREAITITATWIGTIFDE